LKSRVSSSHAVPFDDAASVAITPALEAETERLLALLAAAFAAYITWKYIARQRFLRQIRIARITPEELKAMLDGGEDVMVVDVRHRVEFESEPTIIPGALHLMIEELEARQQEVPRDRDIVLYCT